MPKFDRFRRSKSPAPQNTSEDKTDGGQGSTTNASKRNHSRQLKPEWKLERFRRPKSPAPQTTSDSRNNTSSELKSDPSASKVDQENLELVRKHDQIRTPTSPALHYSSGNNETDSDRDANTSAFKDNHEQPKLEYGLEVDMGVSKTSASVLSKDRVESLLIDFILNEKPHLNRPRGFYPIVDRKSERLAGLAGDALLMAEGLQEDGCGFELSLQLMRLVLYDLVVLVDDSATIDILENGARKTTLQQVLAQITEVYTHARKGGILSVRFFNNAQRVSNFTPEKVPKLFRKLKFNGCQTRTGTELRRKVLDPYLYEKAEASGMGKPLLIIILTDGGVEGEQNHVLRNVIAHAVNHITNKEELGPDALAFQFATVGNDSRAAELIRSLVCNPLISRWIDCFAADDYLKELVHEGDTPRTNDEEVSRWNVLRKLMLGPLYEGLEIEMDDSATRQLKEAIAAEAAVTPRMKIDTKKALEAAALEEATRRKMEIDAKKALEAAALEEATRRKMEIDTKKALEAAALEEATRRKMEIEEKRELETISDELDIEIRRRRFHW
ncbi:hypothetical protein BJ508DRAFT_415346 [Ascobolus immersus RN42]|uniref:VWFA domain-containing protein n=1 Tax=Ascobolus immersus RN42 TaxID=1160509 RepID=A0A3N4IFT3_ASCIM|nr:hypothetical protein BJ508DRAFT_415346 [Ascobolus immersus RN42]